MDWEQHGDLAVPRCRHACGTIKSGKNRNTVLAVGGWDNNRPMMDTVEMMDVTDESFDQRWTFGPTMPLEVSNPVSATTSGQNALFIIGGTTNQDYSSTFSVLRLQFLASSQQWQWTTLDHDMRTTSASGVALTLPFIPLVQRDYPNSRDCSNGKSNRNKPIFLLQT